MAGLRTSRGHTGADDTDPVETMFNPRNLIFCIEQDYTELLPVGLSIRMDKVLDDGLGLLGARQTAFLEGKVPIFDQGDTGRQ